MRFGTRLFVGAVLILLVTVATLLIAVRGPLRGKLETLLATELAHQAHLIAVSLGEEPPDLQVLAHRYGGLLDRRVTFIAEDGRVLGDSDFDDAGLRLLENHRHRPEVAAALSGGTGIAKRLSESTHRIELKVAIRSWPGVVRVSAPLAEVEAAVGAVERAVLIASLAALAVGTVLAALGGRAVSHPLRGLARTARSIAAGLPPVYPASSAPEIRHLSATLRGMQEELEIRIAELQRERDESEAIIESMTEGVLAVDAQGQVLTANSAVRRLLGYASGAPLPNVRTLFHEREVRRAVDQVLEGSAVWGREVQLNGRALLLTGRALPDGAAVLVLRDISELKRLDAVRRDFVANVSHELKTPLTSISGYAETILSASPDAASRQQFLEVILANAKRMQHLVDDLLDLARIESGQWRVRPRHTDIAATAREAFLAFADRAGERGVQFDLEVPPGTTAWVDPEAFRQVLDNLFDNAVRHTPSGGRIRLRAGVDGAGVSVAVSDTGSGIPHHHLPRVFERFYRVDPGRSRQEGGTGLGLAIVRHLVEAHEGTVGIESAVGQGTTVTIRLPGEEERKKALSK